VTNGVDNVVEPAEFLRLIKLLLAPVSIGNCNLAPVLVSYFMYGMLERRRS